MALPTRSEHPAPPFTLPELPVQLAHAPAVTADLELLLGEGAQRIKQRRTVTRTSERVHISLPDRAVEWLFVRNPVDVRRVSASLVEHHERTIVEYDESELRTAGLARGWADVVSFGVEPRALRDWSATGRSQTRWGFDFIERRSRDEQGVVQELWWSEAAAAPLQLSGSRQHPDMVVTSLRGTIDPTLIMDPRQRFSAYAVMDIADFREAHHDHGVE